MKKTIFVTIEKQIEVEIDKSKFDETFMQEFRDSFYKFNTINEHIEHLAQLAARGYANRWSPHELGEFIEGYGHVKEMGIKLEELSEEVETGEFGIL